MSNNLYGSTSNMLIFSKKYHGYLPMLVFLIVAVIFLTWQWCNQCLLPLMLWVRISIRVKCTTLCNKVCQWLVTGRWFALGLCSSFLHEKNWPPRYIWNIVESSVKHHQTNQYCLSLNQKVKEAASPMIKEKWKFTTRSKN